MIETIGLITVGTWLGNKLLGKGFDKIYSKVTSKSFNAKFYKKVDAAAKKLQEIYPKVLGGNIEYFFKNQDVFNELMKLLFINSKVSYELIEEKFDMETLPKDFILDFVKLLKEELYLDDYFKDLLANKEIYLIVVGISNDIKDIKAVSLLSHKEIKSIQKLLRAKIHDTFSISTFLKNYKKFLENNFSQLNFIGLGLESNINKGKRKKLKDLFVKPTFSIAINKLNQEFILNTVPDIQKNEFVTLRQIFNFNKNLVIIGNPGSGKSILTKFIALKIFKKDKSVFETESIFDRIPFRVELRKFHAFKKEYNKGLIKYLKSLLEIEYSLDNITDDNIESILLNQQTMMIFDGLDEIFDLNDKISIRNDIQNFIDKYENSRVVVTSRIIGYSDASFQEDSMIQLSINDFDNDQIEEYVKNWYSIEEEDQDIREREIEDLLSKRNLIDDELISNPLLLSLIVILYRNNLKVPESKLEIYQSCTKTLVDKWDHSKEMEINLSQEIYKRKDTIFADLAYWQYKELSTEDGKVTYQRAKNTVAKTLVEKLKISDEFTTDSESEDFLTYAQKRSLYFDNNFTHKTFLEYYTAYWIFTNIEKKHKKDERNDLISEYIINPYWHIVLELLLNMIDKDQADNEIMDDLINYQLEKNKISSVFFLQIFSTVQNVSLQVFKNVFDVFLHVYLDKKSTQNYKNGVKYDREMRAYFVITEKLFLEKTFRKIISESIFDLLKSKTNISKLLLSLYLELKTSEIDESNIDSNDIKIKCNFISSCNEELFEMTPLIYVMKEFITNELSIHSNPIPFASKILEKFDKTTLDYSLKAEFANFRYLPLQVIFLKTVLFSDDIRLLKKYLFFCEKNNIELTNLVNHVFSRLFFIEKDFKFQNLIENFKNLNDNSYFHLLLVAIYQIRMYSVYEENHNLDLSLLNDLNLDDDSLKKIYFILDKQNMTKELRQFLIKECNLENQKS
ncbi:NACHT domain-containing protein [Kordia algicida OT-1]|uniref:Putative signal transduction protein with Nacht domain n=1 Tax=Kordia algicida OT-1 TaxID=391587 RepID=A9DMN7_9FLAO|nr:NACHT domain-containing protein [Kordia algicida]EDP97752.1 putative signal transduction protein with Nacht domain [Kordia algicida OT-1]